MTQESVLVLEHVAVGYSRRVVLPDVNLSLRRGSFTGLLGANGSGKSTLLKTILGILPPLEGRIALIPVNGQPPVLGYMPQRESLDPIYPLSCFEIVLMAATLPFRFSKSTIAEIEAPDRLGGHTREALVDWLGMSEAEIDELDGQGALV